MEKQFEMTVDGQQVEKSDVDLLGETGALADDRVFAELFRMTPFDGTTVSKAVLPAALSIAGAPATTGILHSNGTVQSDGSSGKIRVKPIRVLIGSRTALATDARANLRDLRSGLSVADGATTADTLLSPAAQPSGSTHRCDAIVARVDIDANSGTPKVVKTKSPTSGVVTAVNVYPYKATNVTVQIVTGTGTSPPALPPDVAGVTYYVLIALVDVVNGFTGVAGGSETIANSFQDYQIKFVANVLSLHRGVGGRTLGPANCYLKNQLASSVPFPNGAATGYAPTSMQGGDSLFFHTGNAFNPGGGADKIIDDRDWRNRICKWTLTTDVGPDTTTTPYPPWDQFSNATSFNMTPGVSHFLQDSRNSLQVGMAQTFRSDSGSGFTGEFSGKSNIIYLDFSVFDPTFTGKIIVYCDFADGGKLKVNVSGSVPAGVFAWLDFTAPYENHFVKTS